MSRDARIPFDISPSPKVSSLDCNVILQPVATCRTAFSAVSFFVVQALDYRETYHWLNAMSLPIPVILYAMIEECSAKIRNGNSFLRLADGLLLKNV